MIDRAKEISACAERLLSQDTGAVVRLRLLRDVLHVAPDDALLGDARRDMLGSIPVRELVAEQERDGGWGRFHSQDTDRRQRILTTEMGVQRALALGLEPADPPLNAAIGYMVSLLNGELCFPDPHEANERWDTGWRLFVAATLAAAEPNSAALEGPRRLWVEIVARTFASGGYDEAAERIAHRALTGIVGPLYYLQIGNRYAGQLVGSVLDDLPPQVERAYVRYLWHLGEGLRYLGQALERPPDLGRSSAADSWMASHELLSRFPSWRGLACRAVEWLWSQRRPDGLWDLGPRPAASATLPLSASWRKRGQRAIDHTTRVLALLARHDG